MDLDVQDKDDNVVVQSGNEKLKESMNIVEGVTARRDVIIAPEVGMLFKSEVDMYDFYKKYAYAVGFPIKKRNSKKGDDGVLRYLTLTCSHEGRIISNSSSSLKPRPTVKMGCKARISASSDTFGNWRINVVNLDHNHDISPSKSKLYRCNRQMSTHVKQKLQMNDLAGIPLHKSYNVVVVEAGGYENITCIEKDCRNYIDRVRRLRLGEGDAAAIQTYFSKMQAQCLGFYFSMDLDDESRLRNVFWADNRCRQAYKEFGDVVTFDTTYLTNKYDMPFTPFVGVNHHGQSTLLGCEFEDGWRAMIEEYHLHDSDWLSGLYENRGRWYERALRSKVEKEFQADFKSFSQMVPCATQFEMEQQYQSVYTISKFCEVQAEFMGKVYCDILSTFERCSNMTYEVRETIMCEGHRRKKTYIVAYERDKCEIICTCHLFEFWGILCKHAITVLAWNDVTHIPDKYILRRWMRDVRRAHTRVAVNYDGLVNTPTQLRYEEMSNEFAQLVNLAAEDEIRSRAIVEWIKYQCKELTTTKSSIGSNFVEQNTI
ncbi:protein FAR-RED IMPAIRED RESPONSE 1-like [Olea europaea var. sylvestris]|uniref:protein FAR-RED IMPAIRED RESPONSE 1-like n=1 Tax=Olea europaea var. sylvestris TaxID=158386 RepID=UPI000C1D1258|nr:protein FAR-RED IMPAIRED RESPONSE 1-like [Olea europaea var. sylvestris]